MGKEQLTQEDWKFIDEIKKVSAGRKIDSFFRYVMGKWLPFIFIMLPVLAIPYTKEEKVRFLSMGGAFLLVMVVADVMDWLQKRKAWAVLKKLIDEKSWVNL